MSLDLDGHSYSLGVGVFLTSDPMILGMLEHWELSLPLGIVRLAAKFQFFFS